MSKVMKGIGACLLILLLLAGIAPALAEDVEIKQLVPMFSERNGIYRRYACKARNHS
jgi:hypothetical protein